jgi:hypothetical protein
MLWRGAIGLCALVSATSCVAPSGEVALVSHAAPVAKPAAQAVVPAGPSPLLLAPAPVVPGVADATATIVAPPFMAPSQPDEAARALDCLTQAIYYEARSEPLDGQEAVAQVVLNRVRNPAFPNSVCGTVYEGSSRRTGCQFTFTCDGSMAARIDGAAWDRARRVAQAALDGFVYTPIGSATYYHTTAVSPWWAPKLAMVGRIGAHIFYRLPGAWGGALAYDQRYSGNEPLVTPGVLYQSKSAAEVVDAIEAGVTVHRGGQDVGQEVGQVVSEQSGVRVHRSSMIGDAAPVAAAPVSAPVAAPAILPAGPTITHQGGVTVHVMHGEDASA